LNTINFNILRAKDWWEHKFPPILAIGYANILMMDKNISSFIPNLLEIIVALVVGAIYVSIINDITDIDDDAACGKTNRMTNVSMTNRKLLVIAFLLLGAIAMCYYYPDILSMSLYALSWIAFSFYSIPPFRFKKRKLLGLCADAFGSSLFPSLFIIARLCFVAKAPIPIIWFIVVGIWSLLFGLRGILWHQYNDRKNDFKSGIHTLATELSKEQLNLIGISTLILEILVLIFLLLILNHLLPFVFLGLYLLLLLIRNKRFDTSIIAVFPNDNNKYHILLKEYYQVFFPLSLLITAGLQYQMDWICLAGHWVLFPKNIYFMLRDYFRFFESIIRKNYTHHS
jgi:hypothetical protein